MTICGEGVYRHPPHPAKAFQLQTCSLSVHCLTKPRCDLCSPDVCPWNGCVFKGLVGWFHWEGLQAEDCQQGTWAGLQLGPWSKLRHQLPWCPGQVPFLLKALFAHLEKEALVPLAVPPHLSGSGYCLAWGTLCPRWPVVWPASSLLGRARFGVRNDLSARLWAKTI